VTRGGVAIVTSGFPRTSETFALNELLALEASGLLAGIFATKPGDGSRHPGSERLAERAELLPGATPREQAGALAARLEGRRVVGIHGYFAHAPAEVAARAAARLRVPYGFSVHARDARKITPAELGARARGAACVVACNGDVADEVSRAGGEPLVVPHGVDLHRFRPKRTAAGMPAALLAVGRLVPKKGFDVLIAAAARLTQPFRLRIVGEGPERDRLAHAIDALDLGDRVELCGARTHRELPDAYARAAVVVVPSVADATGDRDGLPNVVLEAMASARPVVAGDIGAVASAVDADTGLLVPPGDANALAHALDELLAAPGRREGLGRAARARVERDFDLGRCTSRLLRTLEAAYG
jgi:glycosyltransferase involved in cell wall biosynthesis